MHLHCLHPSACKCNIHSKIHLSQTVLLLDPGVCVSGSGKKLGADPLTDVQPTSSAVILLLRFVMLMDVIY